MQYNDQKRRRNTKDFAAEVNRSIPPPQRPLSPEQMLWAYVLIDSLRIAEKCVQTRYWLLEERKPTRPGSLHWIASALNLDGDNLRNCIDANWHNLDKIRRAAYLALRPSPNQPKGHYETT